MHKDIISSAQNPAIKNVRKLLTSGKYRREQGLAAAEGAHLLNSMIMTDIKPRQVVCAESALETSEVAGLLDKLGLATRVLTVKDSLFESLSQVHAAVGVIAIFQIPSSGAVAGIPDGSVLLEDVQDPGNLGTILRTATVAGVAGVYISAGSASPWSPKALRAGMGAQFGVAIYENADLLTLVTDSSISVLATDLSADNSLYDTDLTGSLAWVFGSEGQGVSPQLLELCTGRVRIPQAGNSVESLNVSAAVAVCLFEQHRQRSRPKATKVT